MALTAIGASMAFAVLLLLGVLTVLVGWVDRRLANRFGGESQGAGTRARDRALAAAIAVSAAMAMSAPATGPKTAPTGATAAAREPGFERQGPR